MSGCCPNTNSTMCGGSGCTYSTSKKASICTTVNPSSHFLLANYAKLTGNKLQGLSQATAVNRARAAFLKGTQWDQGYTIKVGFYKNGITMDGQFIDSEYTKDKADWVQHCVMTYIQPLVNLKFSWDVPVNTADVRISFISDAGAYSAVGTQALDPAGAGQPTMNLGWLDHTENDTDIIPDAVGKGSVVVHEFLHTMGMIHEHSRADAPLVWNKNVVYAFLGCQPNCWDKPTVDSNVFQTYPTDSFNGSEYDPKSIMHYYFPPEFFSPPVTLPHAVVMSDLDKEWLTKTYPIGGNSSPQNSIQDISSNSLITYGFVAVCIAVLLIVVYFSLRKRKKE